MSAIQPLKFKVTFHRPEGPINPSAVPRMVLWRLAYNDTTDLWYASRQGARNAASRASKRGVPADVQEFKLVPA